MKISRLEESTTSTFVRLDHDTVPVYVERFIPIGDTIRNAIEDMAAELEILADAYKAPEVIVQKTNAQKDSLMATIRPAEVIKIKDRKIKNKSDKEKEEKEKSEETVPKKPL